MTKRPENQRGNATLKATPADADGWNAEIEKLRRRLIDKHGEGVVRIYAQEDQSGKVRWTWTPEG